MRKVPPLNKNYPEFSKEFEETKPPTILPKVDPTEPPTPKVCQKRPNGWWKEYLWIIDRGREPTAYELMHDFIIGKTFTSAQAVNVSSMPPSRLILFEIEHPERGIEYVRLFISPTDVIEGPAEEEPDVIIKMNYYDLVAMLCGDIPVINPVFENRVKVIGNITALIDLYDMIEATLFEKPTTFETVTPRPKMWPIGHP